MIKIWLRNFLFFRKTFLVSMFWTVLEPLLYLGGLGFGFGRYIPPIESLPFIDFYFAGLLCATAMMVSYFEATYPNFTKLTYQRTYATMLLTPLKPEEILYGEILWAATKGMIGAIGVMIVSSFLGLYSHHLFTILPILFLLSLIFASFGIIMISIAKNYDTFTFSTSGFIIPLSLFSGTYFSLNDTPFVLKFLAYLFPLAHGLQIVRGLLYRDFSWMYAVHGAVLFVYLGAMVFIARRLFKRKLVI